MKVALLDLDIPVYRCAISCEKDKSFDTVKETVDYFILDWINKAQCSHYIGFLTDSKSNFRNQTAVTWPYKGHRGIDKPKYYQQIRQYLMEHWHAQMMVGIEADDALAIVSTNLTEQGTHCVIVTEDKDLLQVPGFHYNSYKDKEVFEVDGLQGFKNLWRQVITGDKTDNIPGVSHAISESSTGRYNRSISSSNLSALEKQRQHKRYPASELFGPATAKKYLDQYPFDEWPMRVWELYIDKYEYGEGDEGYGDLRFHETFDLIFMLREEPEGININYTPLLPPLDDEVAEMFLEF